MPVYRIHRMRDAARQSFRWAAHTAGAALAKHKDYELGGEVEANSAYAAWAALQEGPAKLVVGDILEDPSGILRIYKYVGFEEATWFVPDIPIRTALVASQPASGPGGC